MKKKLIAGIIILVAVALVLFIVLKKDKKAQDEEKSNMGITSKEPPKFNADRAWKYLTDQVDFGPRNPNSTAHDNCLKYFNTVLSESTGSVSLQSWAEDGYDGEKLNLTNVIASFNPESKTRILLCAHWDSRPRADRETDPKKKKLPIPGANDGASGVAILLELAKLMKDIPPSVGVDLVLLDGEDYGREGDLSKYFLGSRYFGKNKPANYYPVYGILLDLVGDKNMKLPKEAYSTARFYPMLVEHIWNIGRSLNYGQFNFSMGGGVEDDHVILNDYGIQCIDIIDIDLVGNSSKDETRNYWHSLRDTPDKCSKESLKAVGDVLLELIYKKPLI
jgi:glutaminyl-peptide cyclotransferase